MSYTLLRMFVCRQSPSLQLCTLIFLCVCCLRVPSALCCAGYSLTNCGSPVMWLERRYALLLPVPAQAHTLSWKFPRVCVREDVTKLLLHTFLCRCVGSLLFAWFSLSVCAFAGMISSIFSRQRQLSPLTSCSTIKTLQPAGAVLHSMAPITTLGKGWLIKNINCDPMVEKKKLIYCSP